MSNNMDLTNRLLLLLDNAAEQAEQCTKSEMKTLVTEIQTVSLIFEDEMLGHLIRSTCISLMAAPSSNQRTNKIHYYLQDIKKVKDRLRSVRETE